MTPKRFMVIAGEASGDMLAAELVTELRATLQQRRTYTGDLQPLEADLAPRFFGAGGPHMAAAGVELAFDMTRHAVVGLVEVVRHLGELRRRFAELLQLAKDREPHVIICVDFQGFNRRFGHAVKQCVRARRGSFNSWNPKIVQYVSPQVWASREGRARKMAADFDLLLSIIPFEKAWYAARLPKFPVEFVGHPMLDRYADGKRRVANVGTNASSPSPPSDGGEGEARVAAPASGDSGASPAASVVLLPGSRKGELERHLPVMIDAWRLIQAALPAATATMVLPNDSLLEMARRALAAGGTAGLKIQIGGLAETLGAATVAIACTGTVTMECAYFGVPTVALYRTSWSTYEIGKRVIKVKYLAMPNLLADEPIFPEFIQRQATPGNLARAALELLRDEPRRARVQARLREIIATLGGPGATRRAATAIAALV